MTLQNCFKTKNHNNSNFNIIPDQQQDTTTLQIVPDPSETATIQNVPELSDVNVNNTQSLTITNGSNILQLLLHNITQNPNIDQNQNDTTRNVNQDNTSILSTSNTQMTQPFQA